MHGKAVLRIWLAVAVHAAVSACESASSEQAPPQAKTAAPPTTPAVPPAQAGLLWSQQAGGEFHHQLRGWVFRPEGVLAVGSRELALFAPTGERRALATAREGEMLTAAPDGSYFGRMRFDRDLVGSFELLSLSGQTRWRHGPRGHHYYHVAVDGSAAGLSSNVAHPGKPGSTGRVVFYDASGRETGRADCARPGVSGFAGGSPTFLMACGESISVLDRRGTRVVSMRGRYRRAQVSADGRTLVAVPEGRLRSLAVASAGAPARSIELDAPVHLVALAPAGDAGAVVAGGAVHGVDLRQGRSVWRAPLQGSSPIASSLSIGPDGVVAVGVLPDGERAMRSPAAAADAAVELFRNGRRLDVIPLRLPRAAAFSPAVVFDSASARLLVTDPSRVQMLDLGARLRQ